MLNLQLKLGAFGQNAQGFEKDYRGEPEPPARGLGSVLPEIKNYGAGGEFVRERLEGTNKEGFGVSRYEFIRNQQRIEYPSVLFPQAPLALAKEQIKQIAQMLTKDYIKIRNSYLPDSSKQDMITQALLKVKGFPAPLVRVADRLAEDRMLEYEPFETMPENDIFYREDEVEEVLSGLETQELTEIVLAGGGMGMDITPQMREEMYNSLRRAFGRRPETLLPRDVEPEIPSGGRLLGFTPAYPTVPNINRMSGEGGDLEDIVAGDDSAPLKVAMPAPQAMDALGLHRGQPIREERRTYKELLRILPDTIAKESFDALTPTEQSNLRKAYRLSEKPMPTGIEAKRASKFAKAQRITGGALPREPEATASATSSVPAPMTREELRRATQQD